MTGITWGIEGGLPVKALVVGKCHTPLNTQLLTLRTPFHHTLSFLFCFFFSIHLHVRVSWKMFLFLKHTASSHLPPNHWENRIWVHSRYKESWVQTCPLPSRAVCQWVVTSPAGDRLMRLWCRTDLRKMQESSRESALFLSLEKRCLPLGQGSQRVSAAQGRSVVVFNLFSWRVMGVKGERTPSWQELVELGRSYRKQWFCWFYLRPAPSLDPSAVSQQHWVVPVPLTPQSPREKHNWHSNTQPWYVPWALPSLPNFQ